VNVTVGDGDLQRAGLGRIGELDRGGFVRVGAGGRKEGHVRGNVEQEGREQAGGFHGEAEEVGMVAGRSFVTASCGL
jgi:hypothetical protein